MEDSRHAITDFDQHLARFESNSDVVVKCGGRKWNLHKEGQPDEISIQDQDEYMIEYLIEYIYTGDFNWRKLQGDLTLAEVYMDVFDLADHFLLPDLRRLCEEAFTEMMLDIVAESQVNGPVGGIDTTKLLGVVREVYTRENSVAVEMFKHTVGIAIHSALPRLESAKLIDLINEIPAVGGDIRAFSLSRHQLCGGYPDYCIQCGTPCIEDLGFLAMVLPTGGPIYFCHHCRPDRLNNEGRW